MLPDFDPDALAVCQKLRSLGFEAYLVGGAVRDSFLARPVKDLDIATNARPEKVLRAFPHAIPTGLQHGTVTVVRNEKQFEVTTYRRDGKYTDGRHPDEVSFSDTLVEDLERRDFTINALAYDPFTHELVDMHGGVQDLHAGVLRAIGEPQERFAEDALRMLRACRFASQLGFEIEEKTFSAIKTLKDNLKKISAERVRDELVKIIASPKPSIGLEAARTSGLLAIFMPELQNCYGVSQNTFHKYDVYYHILHVVDAFEDVQVSDYRLRLSGLFHDIAKPQTKRQVSAKEEPVFYNHEVIGAQVASRVMRRLKFSNEDIETVTHLVRHHMFHYTPEWTKGAIRRFIRNVGEDFIQPLFKLREADRKGNGKRDITCEELEIFKEKIKEVFSEESAFQIKDLRINGTQLMEKFALRPGPVIGKTLNYLLEKVLDEPELNREEKLMALAEVFVKENV
ncbi:MAG: HD domain-containing protein [Spirochaetia bacterium]|nr:HD domain-containing protein [Spirochaetia bacterium]